MNQKGVSTIHVVIGVLWIVIITIYVLILFFPVSVEITSHPFGAEVFLGSHKVGETPTKLHPLPPEGSWITIFKVEYLPYCVEYAKELKGGIYADLMPTDDFTTIEIGITLNNISYVNFIRQSGNSKKLTLDEYGGFFQILNEELNLSEEDLKQFLMNCYSEKEIVLKHTE